MFKNAEYSAPIVKKHFWIPEPTITVLMQQVLEIAHLLSFTVVLFGEKERKAAPRERERESPFILKANYLSGVAGNSLKESDL